MTNLSTKQREALQALADVMQEHEIELQYDSQGIDIVTGNTWVSLSKGYLEPSHLTKLLQEKE